ncbi:suppressor of lurcher protein 1 [Ditylenchus destructor]|uniref:Suppressor of lurcher protein 1 n=1 Tax=Ditylenchus destructor TaxID=166010 RepID=A0AAD4MMC8_9BILA|nr:suppressor of lurcher protein 1 [Ditylenchus destructor]
MVTQSHHVKCPKQVYVLFLLFFYPRGIWLLDNIKCPVRIISTRVHDPTSLLRADSNQPEFGEWEGEALPTHGKNIHPWAHNNSGFISSEQFSPAPSSDLFSSGQSFKCQFIFLGAVDEHVQLTFHYFRLYTIQWSWQNISSLRCEHEDHVTAHVLVGSRMSKIYDFCGRELPPPLMSTKNLLTIDYIVKSFGNGRTREKPSIHLDYDNHEYEDYGFGLEYRFLQDYGQQPKEAIKNPNQSCSFTFNGTVKSWGKLWDLGSAKTQLTAITFYSVTTGRWTAPIAATVADFVLLDPLSPKAHRKRQNLQRTQMAVKMLEDR